ncbi:MAG TPA: DUF5655 domain-containing protein [Thermoanaerobaculia bacterium]|nr:DUF5655 domain-containing protein [Thermoanaerobaculia bacterium]
MRPPLWRCPDCGREFANRNQTHTCAALRSVDEHFSGKDVLVRELFDIFVAQLSRFGPFQILPEKTRIAFHVRMSFAQVTPRRHHLDGHLVLAKAFDEPTFRKVETISKRNHVHHFRLSSASEITPELVEFLGRAYAVGCQEHVRR